MTDTGRYLGKSRKKDKKKEIVRVRRNIWTNRVKGHGRGIRGLSCTSEIIPRVTK